MVGPEQETPEYREDEVRVAPGIELSFDPQRKLFINTLGNCACLGPYPESNAVDVPYELQYDENKQLELPAGYSVHNIDFPGQMASLLAGAGTLAWIAKNGLES